MHAIRKEAVNTSQKCMIGHYDWSRCTLPVTCLVVAAAAAVRLVHSSFNEFDLFALFLPHSVLSSTKSKLRVALQVSDAFNNLCNDRTSTSSNFLTNHVSSNQCNPFCPVLCPLFYEYKS